MNKLIRFYYFATCFRLFMEEIEDTKKTFEITWPLGVEGQNYAKYCPRSCWMTLSKASKGVGGFHESFTKLNSRIT